MRPDRSAPLPPPAPSPRAASPLVRYLVAAAAVAGATLVVWLADTWLAPGFFFVHLAAVFVAGWLGGLGPGLLATALSVLALDYFFMQPRGAFGLESAGDAVRLGFFALFGAGASLLNHRLREARLRAEEHAAESERLALQLQDQAVELERQTEEAQSLNEELEQQVEESHRLRMDLEAANAQLRASAGEAEAARARLGRILQTMAEGVLLVGADGRVTFANRSGARVLGMTPEQVAGRRIDDPALRPLGPDGAPAPVEELPVSRVLRTGEPVHGEELVMHAPDGGRLILRVSAAPLRGPEGEVAGVVASFDDVTAGREAQERVRESEARFRALADTAPVMIWMAGPDADRTFFNQPWLDFTGRTLEQEAGSGWAEGVHPDDYPRCLTVYLSSIEARRAFRMEYRLRRRDGEYRWVLDTGLPRFRADGAFYGYVGSCLDITERRAAEEQLRFLAEAAGVLSASLDSEETLRRICRLAVPVLADFCVVDLLGDDGTIRRVEMAHADPGQEPLLRELFRFVPDAGSEHPVARALRTGTPQVENEVTAPHLHPALTNPEHREVVRRLGVTAYMVVPLIGGGRVLGAMLLCSAGSGRRYEAHDLVRAEELARRAALAIDNARLYERAVEASRAKSDFLAVMSHELRTPLNAIIGYTDLFLTGLPVALPEPLAPQMRRVQAAANHLLELIDEVLTFARLEAGQEEARAEPVPVAAVVRETAAMLEPLAAERGIALRVDPVPPELRVTSDRRKVKQVLANLLGNAVKFTEAGEASLTVEADPGEVRFRVADTGIGIRPEHLERIFEPFWQAEQGLVRSYGGAGLGLSVSRQLARLLGGDITVRSTPDDGSVFTFTLPRQGSA